MQPVKPTKKRKAKAGPDESWPKIVEAMRSVKAPDRDAARYKLAYGALLQLTIYGSGSRENLFKAYGSVDRANAHYVHELKAHHWQVDFLNRLIAAKLVIATGNRTSRSYKAIDRRALADLMNQCAEGGVGFKVFLWPSDYGAPEDDSPNAEQDESEDARREEPVDMTAALVERLTLVAKHLENISRLMDKTNDALDTVGRMEQAMQSFERMMEASAARYEQAATALQTKVEASVGELRSLAEMIKASDSSSITTLATKFIEMEQRRKSLLNQLESEGRKFDSLAKQLAPYLGGGDGRV